VHELYRVPWIPRTNGIVPSRCVVAILMHWLDLDTNDHSIFPFLPVTFPPNRPVSDNVDVVCCNWISFSVASSTLPTNQKILQQVQKRDCQYRCDQKSGEILHLKPHFSK